VVALNSMSEKVGGCDASSPMVEWLEDDLAANRTTCTLAYFHHPLFSSGSLSGGVVLHDEQLTHTEVGQQPYVSETTTSRAAPLSLRQGKVRCGR
jgi:hypothetical protein